MRLWFYRGSHPNFGDELNPWLWSRELPGMLKSHPDENELFLGIGSILFNRFSPTTRKFVFGAGYGQLTAPPNLHDGSWTVRFVRGPQTARLLGLDPSLAIADPAVLVQLHAPPTVPVRKRVGFMPHWESMLRGRWGLACDRAGILLIDPRQPVDDVLEQIASCEMVIAEAMHGAIVADAMRVPWVAIAPLDRRQRMKWHDWSASLDITLRPQSLCPSSWDEAHRAMPRFRAGRGAVRVLRQAPGHGWMEDRLIDAAAWRLSRLAQTEPMLSSGHAMDRAIGRVLAQVVRLRRERALAMA